MGKFCDIKTRNELADFLNIPRKKLTHILYIVKPDNYYTSFDIPKKNGGIRVINAPQGGLKEVQRRLAAELFKYQKIICYENKINTRISHAFEKDKSIITNAQTHRNKKYVLNVDLENFFDSFHFGRVRGYFEKNKYFNFPYEVAVIIAQLACYNGKLPQGAPTSPVITNLVCQILDIKILKLAKLYKLDYTRYADDLTFSTNDKNFIKLKDDFLKNLIEIIEKEGFHINENKTRLQYKDSKQVVTGLVVNKKINVDRTFSKTTRAMANHLYKNGEFLIENKTATINQLEGRFSFINQLDKHNNSQIERKGPLFRSLNGRERQYRTFLFYKYFFANNLPIIVTEGKTDVRYIKSALKSLYKDYPELIEKKEDGTFTFKVSFLKRTKRLEYFLGLTVDGADSLANLSNFFRDTKDATFINYSKYFTKLSQSHPSNPVILIFDNELSNSSKPLHKYANNFLKESQKEKLKQTLYVNVFEGSNLFLITNPLVDDKSECEIENLFFPETLNHEINGRKLSLKDDYDTDRFYGKDIFSKFISDNYRSIDFSRFSSMLDNIKECIVHHQETNS